MDEDDPEIPHLVEIFFIKTKFRASFKDLIAVEQFLERERVFWGGFGDGGNQDFAGVIRRNWEEAMSCLKAIRQLGADMGAQDFEIAMSRIGQEFIPGTIGPGRIFGFVRDNDLDLARMAFAIYFAGNGAGINVGHQNYAPAQAIATIVRYIGTPSLDWDEARAQKDEVVRITKLVDNLTEKVSAYFEKIQQDWSDKIDDYEAKMALRAPKDYWEQRSVRHAHMSKRKEMLWLWGNVLFVVVLIVQFFVLFSERASVFLVPPAGEFGWMLPVLTRFAIIGTSAAMGVWWLKQTLRAARMHHHLAEDAAERVTMIETYSALRAAKLESGDFSAILTALYRPASTSFADDNGPALPLEILFKGLSDTSTRGRP